MFVFPEAQVFVVQEIIDFSLLQQSILHSAISILQDGGRLAYSTCTIDHQENQDVALSFTESIKGYAKPVPPHISFSDFTQDGHFRTLPQRHQTDGSFCTLFQKNN